KSLACYFVGEKESGLVADSLAGFLRERLPEYMLPSEFVAVKSLPLDANGKIDRKALTAVDIFPAIDGSRSTVQADQLELELLKLLRELLQTSDILPDDDLIRLGMHSLLAARFFAQIHNRFGKKLPLATLIESRTVRQLAAVIRDEHWLAPWSSLVALK